MKKQFIILFITCQASFSYANYLDDWTDEDLCRWMTATSIPEHISDEMYVRKLICNDDFKKSELIVQAPYINQNGTLFPSLKTSITTKVKSGRGFTIRLKYKITL